MNTISHRHRQQLSGVPQATRQGLGKLLAWAAVLGILAWSWQGADMRPLDLLTNAGGGSDATGFFPPDFRHWRDYLQELAVTLQMAVCGTALATLCAMPLGLLACSNLTLWWINRPLRCLTDSAHAIHTIIFAMLFVAAVGLGPFAGVLALFVHSIGVLTRSFSEAAEAVNLQPGARIRAGSAPGRVEIMRDLLPRVMPQWLCCALRCFESNLRAATVVGMVGAGGIGVTLWEIIRSFDYAQTCAVLLMIAALVVSINCICSQLRKLCD